MSNVQLKFQDAIINGNSPTVNRFVWSITFCSILIFFAVLGCGCKSITPVKDTGIGRAWDYAWYGTPVEVTQSIQFMHEQMNRELLEKYIAIYDANVIDPYTGKVNMEAAMNRYRDLELMDATIDNFETLSKALADYHGIKLEGPADESLKAANKRRVEFWSAIKTGAKQAIKEIE